MPQSQVIWDLLGALHNYYTSHSTSKEAYQTIDTLILLNTAVNPFVYATISQNLRQKMKRMICCRCPGFTGSWSPNTRIPTSRGKSSKRGKNEVKGTLSHNETKVLIEAKVFLCVSVNLTSTKRQSWVIKCVNYNDENAFLKFLFESGQMNVRGRQNILD